MIYCFRFGMLHSACYIVSTLLGDDVQHQDDVWHFEIGGGIPVTPQVLSGLDRIKLIIDHCCASVCMHVKLKVSRPLTSLGRILILIQLSKL